MPVEWLRPPQAARDPDTDDAAEGQAGSPGAAELLARAVIWPHRSLPRRGFAIFIAITAGLLALPLLPLIGTPVLWGLLPFLVLAVWGVWRGIEASYAQGRVTEELSLWRDRICLRRTEPRGQVRDWEANPYWVRVEKHETGGPVESYLTLKGGPREVEIGAFLSPEERRALYDDLTALLAR